MADETLLEFCDHTGSRGTELDRKPIDNRSFRVHHLRMEPWHQLGHLERAVMEHLWAVGSGDPKAVHGALKDRRRISLNTVQSTLKRLHEKGILRRDKVSHSYVYSHRLSRDEFNRQAVGQVVDQWMRGDADAMISSFVELTEKAGDEELERMHRLVEERIRSRSGEDS